MITYVEGSLFESPATTLVNTVNTTGVMGRGLAAEFKRLYPEMFRQYRELCEAQKIDVGTLWIYRTEHKSVLNFPTKTDWRKPSRVEYIEAGLKALLREYEAAGLHSIAFPALGCGNGGLDFQSQVQPLMENYLKRMAATIYIYPHKHASLIPEHRNVEEMSRWLHEVPEELSFPEVWRDLVDAVRDTRILRTFTTHTAFTAETVTDPQAVRVRLGSGKTVLLNYEDMMEAWKHLRAFGIVTSRAVLSHRSRDMSYLGPVLALLPYVKPIRVSGGYSASDDFRQEADYALQLIPRVRPSDLQEEFELASHG